MGNALAHLCDGELSGSQVGTTALNAQSANSIEEKKTSEEDNFIIVFISTTMACGHTKLLFSL